MDIPLNFMGQFGTIVFWVIMLAPTQIRMRSGHSQPIRRLWSCIQHSIPSSTSIPQDDLSMIFTIVRCLLVIIRSRPIITKLRKDILVIQFFRQVLQDFGLIEVVLRNIRDALHRMWVWIRVHEIGGRRRRRINRRCLVSTKGIFTSWRILFPVTMHRWFLECRVHRSAYRRLGWEGYWCTVPWCMVVQCLILRVQPFVFFYCIHFVSLQDGFVDALCRLVVVLAVKRRVVVAGHLVVDDEGVGRYGVCVVSYRLFPLRFLTNSLL